MMTATNMTKVQLGARKAAWAIGMIAMVVSMAMLTACGSNGGGDGGAALPPGAVPVIPSQACAANQIYTATHGCLYQQSCQNGYGWVPGEGRCVPGTIVNGTGGTGFFTSLTITNPDAFALMLQNSGMCDPYVIGWNFGSASCSNYTHSGYMVMEFSGALANGTLPTQSNIWIGAGSRSPNQPNSEWITGGAVKVISYLTNNAYANNNNGFTGTPMNNVPGGFRFVVNNGLPGSSYQFSVDLMYNGTVFARGTLTRY